jgi:hypothetical protein
MTPRKRASSGPSGVATARVAIVVVAIVMALAPLPRTMVEAVYATGIYPLVRQIVTALSSLSSLVLFDLLLFGGVAVLVGWWSLRLIRAPRGCRLRVLLGLGGQTLVVGATLYLVFLGTWGLNYRRESLADRLDFAPDRVTEPALRTLTIAAIEHLNRLYDSTNGHSWPQLGDLPERLGPAFERTQRRLGVESVASGIVPRRSLLTPYFRRAGIDGMVDPFFLQILVNDTVLPFERPFVTAHEWAHVAGFAHEGEANFVAWLTCLEGDDAMRYSGWSYIVPRLLAALPRDAQVQLGEMVAPGPRADFAAVRARFNRTIPVVRQTAQRVNDRYLKANRVASGVASYGEVLQLAVGTDIGRRQWAAPPSVP